MASDIELDSIEFEFELVLRHTRSSCWLGIPLDHKWEESGLWHRWYLEFKLDLGFCL